MSSQSFAITVSRQTTTLESSTLLNLPLVTTTEDQGVAT